jgi:hypothetical protein
MSSSDRTADDYIAGWLTPSQAVEILDRAYKEIGVSKRTLLERLRGGMVKAVSANSTFHGSRERREVFYEIPSEDWEYVDTVDDIWITGHVTYTRREYGRSEQTKVRHFNVRFKPENVLAIVKATATQAAIDPHLAAEPDSKGSRVADAHLQAWFEFYKKVHTEAEDTEDRALESARLNFPGKSVSRDRVRALRGSLRRGPKKKPE